jgi:hypothetical protein
MGRARPPKPPARSSRRRPRSLTTTMNPYQHIAIDMARTRRGLGPADHRGVRSSREPGGFPAARPGCNPPGHPSISRLRVHPDGRDRGHRSRRRRQSARPGDEQTHPPDWGRGGIRSHFPVKSLRSRAPVRVQQRLRRAGSVGDRAREEAPMKRPRLCRDRSSGRSSLEATPAGTPA